jgi:hypothetical protein
MGTSEEHFRLVLFPILSELRDYLPHIVLIGGWVPFLHRHFGGAGGWEKDPVSTVELDVLLSETPAQGSPGTLSEILLGAGFQAVDRNSPSRLRATVQERTFCQSGCQVCRPS